MLTHYDVIAAEDCPERDPCDWVLEATTCSKDTAGSSSDTSSRGSSSWVVLHEVRGHRFSRRHQLCSFIIPQEVRVGSRLWRLRVTRAADPGRATCMQLACWNLYSTPHSCAERQLLYVDDEMCSQLHTAVTAAAAAASQDSTVAEAAANRNGPEAAAVADSRADHQGVPHEALSTLKRVLLNVQQQSDPKYCKLSVKSGKLQPLLSHRLLLAALLAAGFRPVVQLASAGEQQGELALVADDTSSWVRAAAAKLLQLLDTGSPGAATV